MKTVYKSSVSAAVLSLFLAGAASAADLHKDSPASVLDAPVQHTGWSMFYAGLGVDWLHNRGVIDFDGAKVDGLSADGVEGSVIGGVQRQFGAFVLGAEVRAALSEAKFEVTEGSHSGSIDADYSYAGYGKAGFVFGNGNALASILAGYKCQHVQSAGEFKGYDDTLCGFSGGPVIEGKLTDHWILGADIIYTRLENVDLGEGVKLKPDQWATGLRLTYGF